MVWRETEEANLATSLSKNTGNLQLNYHSARSLSIILMSLSPFGLVTIE